MSIFRTQNEGDSRKDERVLFLRLWTALVCEPSFLEDAIIEFVTGSYDWMRYTYVLPGNRKRKHDEPEFLGDSVVWTSKEFDIEEASQRQTRLAWLPCEPVGGHTKIKKFYFLCGVPGLAAVYIPSWRIQKEGDRGEQSIEDKLDRKTNQLSLSDLFTLLDTACGLTTLRLVEHLCDPHQWQRQREETPAYYAALDQLVILDKIFSAVPGAQVNLRAISRPLVDPAWSSKMNVESRSRSLPLAVVFSCMIYYESGYLDLGPNSLVDALALSNHNSIYVASQLLMDPEENLPAIPIQRIVGNIGKSGLSILVPPINPKVPQKDLESWSVVAHEPFDGKVQDSFSASSLHLLLVMS